MQLGKAYFGAQLKKYDNNPVLAVAAYNAGPGAVDGWIKQFGDPRDGTVSNAQFAAAIPYEETRNYVAKVTGSAGAIPGNAAILECDEPAEKIGDAEQAVWPLRYADRRRTRLFADTHAG